MQFRDRKRELAEIKTLLEKKEFQLIIIYGRRRVGKTELILQATKDRKRIYYLGVGEKNLIRFHKTCNHFNQNFQDLKDDYEVIFHHLKNKVDVIILDEFQNMIQEDGNILNLLQSIVDLELKDSNLKFFIIGSSVSMITSKVLNYQSPLYGRRTASIKLRPIDFYDLREFFSNSNFQELIEIYSFADGIPYYLNEVSLPFWDWLSKELGKASSIFKDEVDFLMRYEFSKPGMYKSILSAISNGKTKLNEIKNEIGAKRTDISPYLKNLIEVDMIFRDVPITENVNSRSGRYYIRDNFLRFWFRFIYPNLSTIEEGIFNISTIKEIYSDYLGSIFEKVVKNIIIRTQLLEFTKLGRWWWKEHEIDLIGLNELKKEIIFIECKWQENVNALRIMKKLEEKSLHVQWNLNERKESYMIFAKSFFKKVSSYKNKIVQCFDIDDMDKFMSKNL